MWCLSMFKGNGGTTIKEASLQGQGRHQFLVFLAQHLPASAGGKPVQWSKSIRLVESDSTTLEYAVKKDSSTDTDNHNFDYV